LGGFHSLAFDCDNSAGIIAYSARRNVGSIIDRNSLKQRHSVSAAKWHM
jgi:hypothetical protein